MTPFPDTEEDLIEFFAETGGQLPSETEQEVLTSWIQSVITQRNCKLAAVNYIFCDDDYLHAMNVEYLQHDTLTDIITFPMESPPTVAGDIFISTERVADNAKDLNLPYATELRRVIIHGILHLCGQGDKSATEATEMRRLEDWALGLLG